MSVMTKLHAPGENGNALCGWIGVSIATGDQVPTCKLCLRELRKIEELKFKGFRREVTYDEALREVASLLTGPDLQPYPELTPAIWKRMRCRDGLPCQCDFCLADKANAKAKADWELSQQWRPHRRHEFPFGSLNAALEACLRQRQDGTNARSSAGSVQARCSEVSKLGTSVQTTMRSDRDPIEIRRTDHAVDVENALVWAFQEEQERRGLNTSQAVAVMLSTVDAEHRVTPSDWAEHLDVSTASIVGLIGHGRRAATMRLAEAGYLPQPRGRR